MQLNKIIFPAPKPTYTIESPNFIPIPRRPIPEIISDQLYNKRQIQEVAVPCMFFPCTDITDKILIFFHANAEDAGLNDDFIHSMKETLRMHVLSVEYPGYGIYKGKPSEVRICEDSLIVFDYLVNDLKINKENIFVMGRSMGSGPSIYLASKRNPGALILISAYCSIKQVAKNMVGIFAGMQLERFRNIDRIGATKCPVLLIHGEKDSLVPCQQSVELSKQCNNIVKLVLKKNMEHNKYNLYTEIINPIYYFLKENSLIDNDYGYINTQVFFNHKVLTDYFKNNTVGKDRQGKRVK